MTNIQFQSFPNSIRNYLNYQLEIVVQNYPFILINEPGEYIHDFRVAIRRSRSIITECKYWLPKEFVKLSKNILGKIAKSTNLLRDYEVFLIGLNDLHDNFEPGFENEKMKFETYLRNHFKREIKLVQEYLATEQFENEIEQYKNGLKVLAESDAENRGNNLQEIYELLISNKINLVCYFSSTIQPAAPADQFHALRIQYKRLRYLVEFFNSIIHSDSFPEMELKLKSVQTILGDLQDCSVRYNLLDNYLEESINLIPNYESYLRGLKSRIEYVSHNLRSDFFNHYQSLESSGTFDELNKIRLE